MICINYLVLWFHIFGVKYYVNIILFLNSMNAFLPGVHGIFKLHNFIFILTPMKLYYSVQVEYHYINKSRKQQQQNHFCLFIFSIAWKCIFAGKWYLCIWYFNVSIFFLFFLKVLYNYLCVVSVAIFNLNSHATCIKVWNGKETHLVFFGICYW